MRSSSNSADYVKGLTVAGIARSQAQIATDKAIANLAAQPKKPEDAATMADLEQLKERIDAAAASAEAEFRRFRLLSVVGVALLCVSILLLHFSRS
jgi:hypothetical protein